MRLLTKKLAAIAGVVFFLGVLAVPDVHAWWDGKWQQRIKIQYDTSSKGGDIKEGLTDIPVLVRLHTGNFSFTSAKADGSDIRFVSVDDESPLKYHIEKFDPEEEIALVWVKVPGISGGSDQDSVWMYYGNPSAADGQDAGGTYDVNQVAVYHFGEKDGNPRDATAYGNHATAFSGKPGLPSVVGNGVQFSGAGEQIKIAGSASLNFTNGFTFSAWVRLNRSTGNTRLFSWDDGSQSIVIGIDDTKAYCSLGMGKGQTVVTPKTAALTPQRWHHLAVTVDPDKQITLYLDGNEAASGRLNGRVPAPSADIIIGASAKGGNAFTGDVDEVQLSNTVRPGGWMKAAFQSQGPDGMLTSYLEEESGGGGGESLTIHLMKVIIRTITLDGWLVIGFLVIMGCASLYIFTQKITTLRQTRKGNETFSKSFRGIDHPLALFEKDQDFQGSSLYRVYRAGCEELKIWLERKGESFKGGNGLSERAMNGFKAAVEKEAMYESRSLSAGMVIMNMSVAGGPFLGLLGTVWGVMNTFASLAESGEANLTAIAPGVASALACTLAGLLVAIPALFASSYIIGHIKNVNADMNVFIDDFILRLEDDRGDAP
ncbi:MAG: flagellar motor protein MotA [Deltaproteobacteria bacterium GWA2_54_12]|nr:MAG: flagellar motor protein MotA [Deltaproteobacteria bacterium GWA2_54_12]